MGLTPIDAGEWLAPDADFTAELAAKRDLLATRADDVFCALPEAEAAARELLVLLAEHLPQHFPAHYARDGDRLVVLPTGESWNWLQPAIHPLDLAARLVQDDLCLMQPADGSYRLTAGSVCSPNRWQVREKLGRPLAGIHAPVPGYAEALHRPVEHFFAAMKPGRILGRVNWGITPDPARFQPVGRDDSAPLDPQTIGALLWLRIERQSLYRLPVSGAMLFTIRTEIKRLDRAVATSADARDLAGALRDMSAAMRRYKHLAAIGPPLIEWLDRIAALPAATTPAAEH